MIRFYIALGIFVVALTSGMWLGSSHTDHRWQKKWDAHVAADKAAVDAVVAQAVAKEKEQARRDTAAAVAQAQAQEKINRRTAAIVKRIPVYVTPKQDTSGCVTYGLVRVLDAAALGADPADLELPAGKSDDACAPVSWADLAASVVDNYGTGHQNAAQLDALIEDVQDRVSLFNSKKEIP